MQRVDALETAIFVLLSSALVFGGASRLHDLRLAFVELAALPVILIAFHKLAQVNDLGRHRFAFILAALLATLPLLQVVPLPPQIWTGLPGRQDAVLALEIAGITPGWASLSLTPDKTWRSLLALLPPFAVFLGVLSTTAEARKRLVYFLLAAALLSVVVGAAQFASGGDRLYPWSTTDAGNIVGFFANRNHLATFCLVTIPFAAVTGFSLARRDGDPRMLWLAALYIGLIVVALGVIRSRAGVVILGPVLAGSLLAAWVAAGRGRPRPALLALMAAAGAAITIVAVFAAPPILARFDTGSAPEGRFENWPIVAEAANNYLPLGSGLGSFDAVYRSVEPLEQLDSTYFNQAHNDYLETWLETGWFGALLLVTFLVWFVSRAWTAWNSAATSQRSIQRASTVAIAAVLIHSAGDYPLRTVAISTVFALLCGLLELSVRSDAELAMRGFDRSRHRSRSS